MVEDDEVDRLRVAIARISRQLHRQAGDGMPRSQTSLLSTAVRRGPLGMRELAAIEGLHATMASRIVASLEAAGLLERTSDVADRRAVIVGATSAGRRLHTRLRRERRTLLRQHLDGLPTADRERLMAAVPAIERLSEVMQDELAPR